MTKKEWRNLIPGAKVTMILPDITSTKAVYNKVYTGVILKANFNWSQVLVKWDDEDTERWYGRLGIEIQK